jgi:hypothetical protein
MAKTASDSGSHSTELARNDDEQTASLTMKNETALILTRIQAA